MPARAPWRVVVVGGGVSGLAAAWFLRRQLDDGVAVTVLEQASGVGGKLRVAELAGLPVDEGAESLLARRPEALELARAVGLGDDLVHPAATGASVWVDGRLRPLPTRTVLGVPADLAAVARARVLTPAGLARASLDRVLPGRSGLRTGVDVSVGAVVRARLGGEVLDRLVEPLLGGVYAGHADLLSLRATVPQLAPYAATERSLVAAARRALPPAEAYDGPVFAGIRGGVGRLPAAVARASGAVVRAGTTVRALERLPGGSWRVVTGPVPAPQSVEADAVVLAVPAPTAARLLVDVAPGAAAGLREVEHASVALVSLAVRAADVTGTLRGTGVLVPPSERRLVKAVTYSSAKWAWLGRRAPGLVIVRASVGRHREEADLQREDPDLVAAVHRELAPLLGLRGTPVDARVTRWGGGLPQYAVGHLGRVERVRASVAAVPGLEVCGAAYEGVGVPACVAGARAAVTRLVHDVRAGGTIGA